MGIVIHIIQSVLKRRLIERERDTRLVNRFIEPQSLYNNRLEHIPPEGWTHAALIMLGADD